MAKKSFDESRIRWSWGCCCKRKESHSQQEYKKRVADALHRIESSLDVLNIIRNFNLLKVIAHLLLDERHFDLAQYVGFDLWRQESDLSKERDQEEKHTVLAVRKSASKEKDKSAKKSARVELEKRRFRQCLTVLKENISNTVKEFDSLNPRVAGWIDTFYYLHLLGNIPESSEPDFEGFNFQFLDAIKQAEESADIKPTVLFTEEGEGQALDENETKEVPQLALSSSKRFAVSSNTNRYQVAGDDPVDLNSSRPNN